MAPRSIPPLKAIAHHEGISLVQTWTIKTSSREKVIAPVRISEDDVNRHERGLNSRPQCRAVASFRDQKGCVRLPRGLQPLEPSVLPLSATNTSPDPCRASFSHCRGRRDAAAHRVFLR